MTPPRQLWLDAIAAEGGRWWRGRRRWGHLEGKHNRDARKTERNHWKSNYKVSNPTTSGLHMRNIWKTAIKTQSILFTSLFVVQIHISRLGEIKGLFFSFFRHSLQQKYNNYLQSLVKKYIKSVWAKSGCLSKRHKLQQQRRVWDKNKPGAAGRVTASVQFVQHARHIWVYPCAFFCYNAVKKKKNRLKTFTTLFIAFQMDPSAHANSKRNVAQEENKFWSVYGAQASHETLSF